MARAEAYLEQIPIWTRKKNSLEAVRDCLEALGSPDREIPAVHVAGTNGKGSVCAFLTSMFREAGYRTGTFISPHLVEVRERFLIDGEPVQPEAFEAAFEQVLAMTERKKAEGFCHPTFFEFLFYMAAVLFKEQKADIMILETGLGGRLDTTNVIERPLACVITSISREHTKYLGDTVEEIAGEKAGIIKKGVPVIFDDTNARVSQVIGSRAFCMNAPRYPVGKEDIEIRGLWEKGLTAEARLKDGEGLELQIPFDASYQAQNAMAALRAAEVISETYDCFAVTREQMAEGIRKTRWAGRMEQIRPGFYLDGAHNPGGIRAFLQSAGEIRERTGKKVYLLFAAVSDKDYGQMAKDLCQGLPWSSIGVVHMNSDRGLSADCLARVFRETASCKVEAFETTEEAVGAMRAAAEGELLFCAGSLYLIGEIESILNKR